MPSPFPGMAPFIEACGAWSDFHSAFLSVLRSHLNMRLPEVFVARTEERVYVVPDERDIRPDVTVFAVAPNRPPSSGIATLERATPPERIVLPTQEVIEHFLEIRDIRRGVREVVIVIEFLSPANKIKHGRGREEYLRKKSAVLNSDTNLIELDLLRGGEHTVFIPKGSIVATDPFDYLVTRSDVSERERAFLWRVSPQAPLPIIQIPLLPELPDVDIDLQVAFEECWDASRYEGDLDYSTPLTPPLPPEETTWVTSLVSR